MTRSRDIADQQENLGGAVAPYVGAKNFAINGGFDIFQRGTYSNQAAGYSLDRWYAFTSAPTTIVTQQTTGVPVGSQYCVRIAYGGVSVCNFWQYIESGNVKALQGKTVTLTAKFRRNTSFSANYVLGLYKSSTVNAGPAASWSQIGSSTALNAQIPTGTTSSDWITVSTTVTIPADGTAEGLAIVCFESANQSSGAYVEVAQVQLEIGSAATPFSRAGGSIGGELALCQRYYTRWQLPINNYSDFMLGQTYSTTNAAFLGQIPVQMRATPTGSSSGLAVIVNNLGSRYSGGTMAVSASSPRNFAVTYTHGSGVFTAGQIAWLQINNSSSDFLELSAEL